MPAVTVVGAIVAAGGFSDLMLPWLTVMALAAPGLAAVCAIHAAPGKTRIAGVGNYRTVLLGGGFRMRDRAPRGRLSGWRYPPPRACRPSAIGRSGAAGCEN